MSAPVKLTAAPCLTCEKKEGEVNHPPGMIFVGWGTGWQLSSRLDNGWTMDRALRTPPIPKYRRVAASKDCGTDGCGCEGCGALCGDEHDDDCDDEDHDVMAPLRRKTG